MIITHESLLKYWLNEPERNYIDGSIRLSELPFPDLSVLSAKEKKALKPVLERHPEYMSEIQCEGRVQ